MHIAKRLHRYMAGLISFSLALLYLSANFAPIALAASLAQGYHSSQAITAGTVVSLTKNGSNEIQTTDLNNEALILGVAVDSQNAIVDLQPSGSDVRVAISGEVPVLVTNLSGDIKAGDNLVISTISGVAAKDTPSSNAKKYIGVASQNFDGKASTAKQVTIKVDGNDKTTSVGLIRVKILLSDRQSNSPKPNPVVAFIENLIGRQVSTAQIVGAVAVFITTFSFTALLLNGSIKGAFVSIGRNPLSKPAIVGNMVRVSIVGLVVLIAGVAMAYVILLI